MKRTARGLFLEGIRDGLPIGIGYFSVSFSFGIAAVAAGLSWWEALFLSMTNITSAGQFAGIGIIAGQGTMIEMAVTQFVINLRYSLMSIVLSQKMDKSFRWTKKLGLGYAVTDEIFAVSASKDEPVRPVYFLGLATLPYIGWSLGTLVGAVGGSILPQKLAAALGVAIYGMFIAIIVPNMRTNKKILITVAIAITISCILYYTPMFSKISSGFAVIICAVVASVIGAILFPVEDEEP